MLIKFTPATLNALARLVCVFDRHPRGAAMLIVFMIVTGGLMTIPYLPAVMA
jgi:hypothetical protein